MAEKQLNGRIAMKHDSKANWEKATNFIPKNGEIIIYDADDDNVFPRMKIGDGATLVNDLDFIYSPLTETIIDGICEQSLYAASEVKF